MTEEGLVVYLVAHDDALDAGELAAFGEVQPLRPGLSLVRSGLDRSPLYHRIKDLQGRGRSLVVARLDHPPKVSRVEPGSATWIRDRF